MNIFDFTTAGDCDCVAAVERLPPLHYKNIFDPSENMVAGVCGLFPLCTYMMSS